MIELKSVEVEVVQSIIFHHQKYNTLAPEMMKALLSIGPEEVQAKALLCSYADRIRKQQVGDGVSYRGLLEFSNICTCDCLYCGIRKSNSKVGRYHLSPETIIEQALWCADQGYGSVMLQSGQREDEQFIDQLTYCIHEIKRNSTSSRLPHGLGITLGIGEQSYETYKRLFDAGSHRYLLRIETTDKELYGKIHPEYQRYEHRLECLRMLKRIGYQVGTGVMIGVPGQSLEMLCADIQFFKDEDIDMLGMGPYIVHPESEMAQLGMMDRASLLQLSLNMIAVARIFLQDVNIAAATALQAVIPDGREQGLSWGANVVMPNATPTDVREGYQLYAGKPCLNENGLACRKCLATRIHALGRTVNRDIFGDSPHARQSVVSKTVYSPTKRE